MHNVVQKMCLTISDPWEIGESVMQELIRLEKEASESANRQDYEHAVELLKRLIEIQPDYEHGYPYYDLACQL